MERVFLGDLDLASFASGVMYVLLLWGFLYWWFRPCGHQPAAPVNGDDNAGNGNHHDHFESNSDLARRLADFEASPNLLGGDVGGMQQLIRDLGDALKTSDDEKKKLADDLKECREHGAEMQAIIAAQADSTEEALQAATRGAEELARTTAGIAAAQLERAVKNLKDCNDEQVELKAENERLKLQPEDKKQGDAGVEGDDVDKDLKEQLRVCEEDSSILRDDIEALRERAADKATDFGKQLSDLRKDLEAKIEVAEQATRDAQGSYSTELGLARDALKDTNAAKAKLEDDLKKCEDHGIELQAAIDATKQTGSTPTTRDSGTPRPDDKNPEGKTSETTKDRQESQATATLTEDLAKLKRSMEASRTQNTNLQQANDAMKSRFEERDRRRSSADRTAAENASRAIKARDIVADGLKRQVGDLKQRLAECEEKLPETTTTSTKDDLEKCEEARKKAENKLVDAAQAAEISVQELKEAREKIETLKTQLEECQDAVKKSAEGDKLGENKPEDDKPEDDKPKDNTPEDEDPDLHEVCKSAYEELENELKTAQTDKKTAEDEVERLQSQIDVAKQAADDLAKCKDEQDKLQSDLKTAQDAQSASAAEVERLQGQIDEADKAVEVVKSNPEATAEPDCPEALRTCEEDRVRLQKELDAAKKAKEDTEGIVDDLLKKRDEADEAAKNIPAAPTDGHANPMDAVAIQATLDAEVRALADHFELRLRLARQRVQAYSNITGDCEDCSTRLSNLTTGDGVAMDDLGPSYTDLEIRLRRANAEITRLRSLLDQQSNSNDSKRDGELSTTTSGQKGSGDGKDKSDCERRLMATTRQLEQAQLALATSESLKEQAELELNALQVQLMKTPPENSAEKSSECEEDCRKAKQKQDAAETELQELKDKIERESEDAEKNIKQTQTSLEAERRLVSELRESLTTAQNAESTANRTTRAAEGRLTRVNATLDATKDSLKECEDARAAAATPLPSEEEAAPDTGPPEDPCADVKAELAEAQAKIEKLEEDATTAAEDWTRSREALNKERDDAEQETADVKDKLNELNMQTVPVADNPEPEENCDDVRERLRKALEDNEKLQTDNDELRLNAGSDGRSLTQGPGVDASDSSDTPRLPRDRASQWMADLQEKAGRFNDRIASRGALHLTKFTDPLDKPEEERTEDEKARILAGAHDSDDEEQAEEAPAEEPAADATSPTPEGGNETTLAIRTRPAAQPATPDAGDAAQSPPADPQGRSVPSSPTARSSQPADENSQVGGELTIIQSHEEPSEVPIEVQQEMLAMFRETLASRNAARSAGSQMGPDELLEQM